MISFDDFIVIKKVFEGMDLDDMTIKVDNADEEFLTKLVDKFSFVVMKRNVKNLTLFNQLNFNYLSNILHLWIRL